MHVLQSVGSVQPLVVPEIVTFPADVDITNSDVVGSALLAAFRPGVPVVIADLSQTEFCDSTGIRWLLIASNQAVCTGSQLRVVVGESAVRRSLHVLGADQTLAVYPDMQAALSGRPVG
jgi:anti-sigma B factor antagonist